MGIQLFSSIYFVNASLHHALTVMLIKVSLLKYTSVFKSVSSYHLFSIFLQIHHKIQLLAEFHRSM